jgi:hypothetical protein
MIAGTFASSIPQISARCAITDVCVGSHRRPFAGLEGVRPHRKHLDVDAALAALVLAREGYLWYSSVYALPIDERHGPIERIARLYYSFTRRTIRGAVGAAMAYRRHRRVVRWPGGFTTSVSVV